MSSRIENAEFDWVKKTIMRNFEHLKINHIAPLGEGWRSRAFLINHELVFRFPKEKEGAIDTAKEIKALPNLKKHISLNIPEFIYCGKQANGFPFVGYKLLPGEPMDEQLFHSLPSETKNKIAEQIAEFMDQISSFCVDQAREYNIRIKSFYQHYLETFREVKKKAFTRIDQEMKTYLSFRFETYLESKNHFSYTPKLLHADLSLDHLLFDQKRQELTGIIDFGDMKMGDPDYEYLYLLEECGEAFTKKVMEVRKEENVQQRLEKLSFFLTADNVLLLLEGLKRNNREIVNKAIEIIQCEMKKPHT
ncbi:phosphotransferase family protein [Fictibacillus terranigra]|uniref:Aminoglycoside 3'-phosphotransferase/choline kinase family protein n=1 Tax=Fictibacillus terranigra TaxID=3058424 RepID=A0ABT8EAM5_9BACL|nr:aminoglycoside 3'-phosphotransferase/choline kinase family protein [Fictibacillus sp. CENA-BCM004]MDN4074970.1 aminoglycoside 3'-phosphotransferase/choline kinase family protein [Fictibacillus sp. CENA-BCM004]